MRSRLPVVVAAALSLLGLVPRHLAAQTTGTISGSVRRADTGAAEAGAVVMFRLSSGGFSPSTTVGADGTFASPALFTGSYYVEVTSASPSVMRQTWPGVNCPPAPWSCPDDGASTVTVTASANTSGIHFLLPMRPQVTGRVTRAADASPVAGVTLVFFDSYGVPHPEGSATTNESGTFTWHAWGTGSYKAKTLPAESTGLDAQMYQGLPCPNGACSATAGTPITATVGQTTSGIDFALPPLGTISGTVTSATTGLPVPDAVVDVFYSNGNLKTRLTPDSAGRYQTPGLRSDATYLVRVQPPAATGLVGQLHSGLACQGCVVTTGTPVTVASSTTTVVNFALQPGGTIAGTVRRAGTGEPLAGARVTLYGNGVHFWRTVETDPQGRYVTAGLVSGNYEIAAEYGDWLAVLYQGQVCLGECTWGAGTPVPVIAPSQTASIDFSLQPTPPAPNDLYPNALSASPLPYSSVVDTRNATTSTDDPTPSCGFRPGGRSVWYVVEPGTSGTLEIDATHDYLVTAYVGSPNAATEVACAAPSQQGGPTRLVLPVSGGHRVIVMVTAFDPSWTGGLLVFKVSLHPLGVAPASLRFAAVREGTSGPLLSVTPAQSVRVLASGSAASVSWTATTSTPWIRLTQVSGVGSGEFIVTVTNDGHVLDGLAHPTGSVSVTPGDPEAPVVTIPVALSVSSAGTASTSPPFGVFEAPVTGATGVVGAIPVTGWALDDVAVDTVKVYRECVPFEPSSNCTTVAGRDGMVFVGDATIVAGARPDVEASHGDWFPQAHRAGWGYMLLTNLLPHVPGQQMFGGQGPLGLWALVTDVDGRQTWLGPQVGVSAAAAITMANDAITKPFGAIDTPAQGALVSGSISNFGWVLTPDADTSSGDPGDIMMPPSGASIQVYVDGAPLGTVQYDLCRGTTPAPAFCDDDIASIFGNPTPQPTFTPRNANPTRFRNLDAGRGAVGARLIDTTLLASGLHTIVWGVADNSGRGEGIGSRYFWVANAAGAGASRSGVQRNVAADFLLESVNGRDRAAQLGALADAPGQPLGDARVVTDLPPSSQPVRGRTGFGNDAPLVEVPAGGMGRRHVQIPPSGRLELVMGPVDAGYLVVGGTLRDLPPGSRLDLRTGTFTWAPGPGYAGTHRLAFVRERACVTVLVTIRPVPTPSPGSPEIRMALDLPAEQALVGSGFTVAGWALDPSADLGAGIDAVHVWAHPLDRPGAEPIFLGHARLGGERPDVAAAFSPQFNAAAFTLTVSERLEPGAYDITAYAWNRRTARWEDARARTVSAR